jgi:hypothetical protein
MPGPTTKLAFRRRALLAAGWMEAYAEILQRELDAHGVRRRPKDMFNRLDGPETVTMKSAGDFVAALKPSEIEGLEAYWKAGRGLPADIDRRLLPQGREAIGGDLDAPQKTYLRTAVQRLVKARTK